MSSEEKNTWIYAVVAFIVPVVYVVYVVGQLQATAVADFAFQRPLLMAIGGGIVGSIIAHILVAIVWPKADDRKDQRDREINRYGEYVGFYAISVGFLPAFALALLEADHFWIANAIYAAYILNALTSSTTKLIAYRRGL